MQHERVGDVHEVFARVVVLQDRYVVPARGPGHDQGFAQGIHQQEVDSGPRQHDGHLAAAGGRGVEPAAELPPRQQDQGRRRILQECDRGLADVGDLPGRGDVGDHQPEGRVGFLHASPQTLDRLHVARSGDEAEAAGVLQAQDRSRP